MKKVLFLIMSAFVALSANAQFDIKYRENDNYYLIKYGLDTTHVIPKGTTYAKLQYGNEVGLFYNSGQPIVNYVSHFLYNINGASVATPNALMDSLSNILGMPLDSVGGGSIAGVEHVNGKDGDLKIIAGSNVTIDNSKSDTIVINATGGDFIPLAGTEINKPVTGNIYFTEEGDESSMRSYIGWVSNLDRQGLVYENTSIPSTSITFPGGFAYADSIDNTVAELNIGKEAIYISSGYENFKGIEGGGYYGDNYTDNTYVQKYYVDSVASGGAYLPLNIQDSTTVELNGNSVMFKGDNHSMVVNTPFDALSIGGAVMDGYRSISYDSIYTMNGVMKVPNFFEDTIRYPMLFMSENLPFVSPNYRTTFMYPYFTPTTHGMSIVISGSETVDVEHAFTDKGYILVNDGVEKLIIDTSGAVVNTEYVEKTSPYALAQMQDLIPLMINNPISPYTITQTKHDIIIKIPDDNFELNLPDVANANFIYLTIINESTTSATVKTVSSEVAIWESGSLSDEYEAPSGSVTQILFDGVKYIIK